MNITKDNNTYLSLLCLRFTQACEHKTTRFEVNCVCSGISSLDLIKAREHKKYKQKPIGVVGVVQPLERQFLFVTSLLSCIIFLTIVSYFI